MPNNARIRQILNAALENIAKLIECKVNTRLGPTGHIMVPGPNGKDLTLVNRIDVAPKVAHHQQSWLMHHIQLKSTPQALEPKPVDETNAHGLNGAAHEAQAKPA